MDQKELEKSLDTKFGSFLDKIKALLKGSRGINALTITTADGTVLDFGDQVETAEEIEVGMTATLEGGGTPEGEYPMPDGRTFVFDNGTLTEIKEAEDDTEALKKENEELKKQIAELQAENKTIKESVQAFQKELTEFRAQVKSDIGSFGPNPAPGSGTGQPENRFANLKAKIGV